MWEKTFLVVSRLLRRVGSALFEPEATKVFSKSESLAPSYRVAKACNVIRAPAGTAIRAPLSHVPPSLKLTSSVSCSISVLLVAK